MENINFQDLATKHVDLASFLIPTKAGATINFKDSKALRTLTYSLLKEFYDLTITIPEGALIPTVTSRVNYIKWIEELLTYECTFGFLTPDGAINGVDIGTGASCIYALLGSKIHGWKFVATDIEKKSIQSAQENVINNNLDDKIELLLVSKSDFLKKAAGENRFHFCMCNPPFFGTPEEQKQTKLKKQLPSSDNPGNLHEAVTKGGEVEFVSQIIKDSLTLQGQFLWYTSLLGKKGSVKPLQRQLKEQPKIKTVLTKAFHQGKTIRWAIAWSFYTFKNLEAENICENSTIEHIDRIHVEERDKHLIFDKIKNSLDNFDINYSIESENILHLLIVRPALCTWSRKARRERQKRMQSLNIKHNNNNNNNDNHKDNINNKDLKTNDDHKENNNDNKEKNKDRHINMDVDNKTKNECQSLPPLFTAIVEIISSRQQQQEQQQQQTHNDSPDNDSQKKRTMADCDNQTLDDSNTIKRFKKDIGNENEEDSDNPTNQNEPKRTKSISTPTSEPLENEDKILSLEKKKLQNLAQNEISITFVSGNFESFLAFELQFLKFLNCHQDISFLNCDASGRTLKIV